jgi:uncharacterized membrane protein YdfJ with MMPL/SSD domain
MGDAIKYLYSQFILRDVLSFITPGAIVVFAATYVFYPKLLHSPIHWLLFIPLFGVCYIVGFALQCFGELFGFIRFTPYGERSWGKRVGIFSCSFTHDYDKTDKSNIWWWEEQKELTEFFEATAGNEGAQQGHERLVVLKQMCGNGFIAIFIAGIFALVYFFCLCTCAKITLGVSLAIILLGSLFWGHRVHMLRQYTRERIIMERLEKIRSGGS